MLQTLPQSPFFYNFSQFLQKQTSSASRKHQIIKEMRVCRDCRGCFQLFMCPKFKKLFFAPSSISECLRDWFFFQLLTAAPSWSRPLAGRIFHVAHEKQSQTHFHLFTRRLPCLSAAKLLRLTHTQGRDELPSEILQPLRGSNSRASLALVCSSRTLQAS